MKSNVSYPKKMRDDAKISGKPLITISVPNLTFQGPCTEDELKEAVCMINRWLKRESEGK